jgi:hypothetical protein
MMSTPGDDASVKVLRLRYAGACDGCGTELPAGTRAGYVRQSKTVRCAACLRAAPPATAPAPALPSPAVAPDAVIAGTAGSSARREYERRSAKREARIRAAHPRLGGLILAVSEEPQSTTAWARGARGEEVLGRRLDQLETRGVSALHDRRIPGTRANIDHLTVGPSGVHVIDAKRHRGRPALRVEGGIIRPRVQKLVVGSRDCTRLVDGVHKQIQVVHAALARTGITDIPVHGVLCFVDADWPLIGGSFVISEVAVLWPKKLGERLTVPGALSAERVDEVHRALAGALPAA